MPPIGLLLGGVDFTDLGIVLKEAVGKEPAVILSYGKFVQSLVDFTIVAFAIFLMVKAINTLKKKEEEAPAAPPKQEVLLTEIRDILKQKS
jgi:large conductance mechanosensitive channel